MSQDSTYNEVIQQLFKIDESDQIYRNQIDDIENKYGRKSTEIKELYRKMKTADSLNLEQVEKIIDNYGWLGYNEIGSQANSTIFMVIQHSNYKTQLKYLPLMREAVKNKKAKGSELALLEDRVSLHEGRKQIYGSQIFWSETNKSYTVAPLEDPDNVDLRRSEVGLSTLNEDLSVWDLKWDIKEYKNHLPSITVEWNKLNHKE